LDSGKIPILQAMQQRMGHLSAQQRVISENLANADTPRYRAKKLMEQDFSGVLAKVDQGVGTRGRPGVGAPSIDMPQAFSKLGARRAANRTTEDKDMLEGKPSGNTVVLEDQLMQMADTQMEYATVSSLYRKQVGMLKIALGKGAR
jgi:flagellar basal-body rod protein FlgB